MALSITGRFLSKAEILGVGVFSPLSKVDSVPARFKNARVEKMSLDIRILYNTVNCGNRFHVGVRSKSASVSGLHVGPSKV